MCADFDARCIALRSIGFRVGLDLLEFGCFETVKLHATGMVVSWIVIDFGRWDGGDPAYVQSF